jgi:hypothetical protein
VRRQVSAGIHGNAAACRREATGAGDATRDAASGRRTGDPSRCGAFDAARSDSRDAAGRESCRTRS